MFTFKRWDDAARSPASRAAAVYIMHAGVCWCARAMYRSNAHTCISSYDRPAGARRSSLSMRRQSLLTPREEEEETTTTSPSF